MSDLTMTAAVARPGDALVITVPANTPAARCQQIKDQLTERLGDDVRLVILAGASVTVVEAERGTDG